MNEGFIIKKPHIFRMNLSNINTKRKNGYEKFEFNGIELDFELIEFWSWNQSNLVENRTRGILAEFIVRKALKIENANKIRTEWDDYDLITPNGLKIEVKSAAYIQTWEQEKGFSKISFDIKLSNQTYYGKNRASDYYVFCLLHCKDQTKINPMKLDQWTFYVKETKEIDRILGKQKTITFNSLITKLQPIKADFKELYNIIQ